MSLLAHQAMLTRSCILCSLTSCSCNAEKSTIAKPTFMFSPYLLLPRRFRHSTFCPALPSHKLWLPQTAPLSSYSLSHTYMHPKTLSITQQIQHLAAAKLLACRRVAQLNTGDNKSTCQNLPMPLCNEVTCSLQSHLQQTGGSNPTTCMHWH